MALSISAVNTLLQPSHASHPATLSEALLLREVVRSEDYWRSPAAYPPAQRGPCDLDRRHGLLLLHTLLMTQAF